MYAQSVSPVFRHTLTPSMAQIHHASGALTIMRFFGLGDLVDSFLLRNGVHRLQNLLSLDPICHADFDRLNLWFEHTGEVRYLSTS